MDGINWLAHLISISLSLYWLVTILRWIAGEMARSDDPALRPAKRGFALSLLGLFLVAGASIAVMLVDFERGFTGAVVRGAAVLLVGIVPVTLLMTFTLLRTMGLQGEGPVELSPESWRALHRPLLGSVLASLVIATLLIWLAGRARPIVPLEYLVIGTVLLTGFTMWWPLLVLKARLPAERARMRDRR